MKRIAAIAALVLAIGLAGCASSVTAGSGQPDASEPRPEVSQQQEETPAPLVAETPTATASTSEQEFVEVLRAAFERDGTQIPDATDEQLLAAGADACTQIAAGTAPESVRVIEGEEEPYSDSARIGYASAEYLCD